MVPDLSTDGYDDDADEKAWPVKYVTLFHMTNDSKLFLKADELGKQGFKPAALNRWRTAAGLEAVPLYEGKMVQMYDHRVTDVVVNAANLKGGSARADLSSGKSQSCDRCPAPQYWVLATEVEKYGWLMVHCLQVGHGTQQYANHDCRHRAPVWRWQQHGDVVARGRERSELCGGHRSDG